MSFNASFESEYINNFAKMVRSGIEPAAYSEGVRRVQKELSEISDTAKKEKALERLAEINSLGFIYMEAKGSRAGIADKIDELADFVKK